MRTPWNRAALCLVAFGLVAGCERVWESDIFWHLTAGEWILRYHALPHQDLWSVAPAGGIVNVYWLFQIIVAILHGAGGFAALSAMKALLLGGIALALTRTVPAPSRNAIAMGCLTVALIVIQARTRARPEGFTLLYLAILLWILESVRLGASRRRLWGLVPLMVLWVNMHSLYILGLIILWSAVVGAWWDARRGGRHRDGEPKIPPGSVLAPASAATLACLLTPEPLRILIHPFVIWNQASSGIAVYAQGFAELVPSYNDLANPEVWITGVLVILAITGLIKQGRRPCAAHLLWLAAFVYLGATASRNLAMTALVAGVIAASTLGTIRAPRRALAGAGALALVLGLLYSTGVVARILNRAAGPGFGLQEDRFATGIAQRIASSQATGDILTLDFGDASALIHGANRDCLDPKAIIHRLWIDGRSDLHTRQQYEELFEIREAFAESRASAARVPLPPSVRYLVVNFNDLALLSNIAASPRFRLLYLDRNQACFTRVDIEGGSADPGDNLADYDRPLHLDPPQALLGPTDRYRRTWWRQHPLETHWTVGTVLSFVGRVDLAARYLECADLLGNGPAADRRGMLAIVLSDLGSGSGLDDARAAASGMAKDPLIARAMWLLDRPHVCDLDSWERRTHDLVRVDLLRRAGALDLADQAIRRHLDDPAVRRAGELDPVSQALQGEIAQALGAAYRQLSDPTLSTAPSIDQAERLARAGLTEEALKRLDGAGGDAALLEAGDIRLTIGRVGEARKSYTAAHVDPQTPAGAIRYALCDWAEGHLAKSLGELTQAGRRAPEDDRIRRLNTLMNEYLGLEATTKRAGH